jgi:hypothetical protein
MRSRKNRKENKRLNIFPPLDGKEPKTTTDNTDTPDCYEHAFYADQLEILPEDSKPIVYGKYSAEEMLEMIRNKTL